ncbi:MarR family transcriptional regulator [Hamadaea tsunoensis]|uniref:MarR family transcriptional regulator n=1 Tax=Hamadaea tsunoensis TaxID=53368 RepID=UPI000400710A|nr:helix-turn-helix domain-containing protein [Hamadaea tsunoensis]
MKAHDLFVLGRELTKIAEAAMREGAGAPATPAGLRLIMADVRAEPGSTIGDIATRTGLPQSYVSESVARLRDRGVVETWTDPADRRRTRVRIGAEIPHAVAKAGAVTVDKALLAAGGTGERDRDRALLKELAALAQRLTRHRTDS